MSWASHPTAEVPTTGASPVGRHRKRRTRRLLILAAAIVLLLLGVAGAAVLTPRLSGSSPAGTAASEATSAKDAHLDPSLAAALDGRIGSAPVSPAAAPTSGPDALTTSIAPARPTSPTTSPAVVGVEKLEDDIVTLTNAERARQGCPPLRADDHLRSAARAHSDDMASRMVLTHVGAESSDPGDRMVAAGYNPGGAWAENVAAGYPTPEAVMAGWMKSDSHRTNILNCDLKAIGVGVARAGNGQLYWTQDFGGR